MSCNQRKSPVEDFRAKCAKGSTMTNRVVICLWGYSIFRGVYVAYSL